MPNISTEGQLYPFTVISVLQLMFYSRDGLGGVTERHPDLNVETPAMQIHPQLEISSTDGVDVALGTLRSYPPRSVTYIVLGPMTNLLHMMRKDDVTIRERIGRVVIMGGALDVPGNTTPVAECEFMSDRVIPSA